VVGIEFVLQFNKKSVFRSLKMVPFNFHGNVKREVTYVNAVVDVMHTYSLQNYCTVELLDCILLGCFIFRFDTCLPLEKKIHEMFICNSTVHNILSNFTYADTIETLGVATIE